MKKIWLKFWLWLYENIPGASPMWHTNMPEHLRKRIKANQTRYKSELYSRVDTNKK